MYSTMESLRSESSEDVHSVSPALTFPVLRGLDPLVDLDNRMGILEQTDAKSIQRSGLSLPL